MDIEKIMKQARRNIYQALEDYRKHTSNTEVIDNVSDEFVSRLAKDNAYAKQELRALFSKSPVWNEDLDALVINGTRTHNPNYARIDRLVRTMLTPAARKTINEHIVLNSCLMQDISFFFSRPDVSQEKQAQYIETIKLIAPKAYAPNKKPSRIFKSICTELHVSDDRSGSDFQRLYAQFADELTAKKIEFKLYVSLNPAHFLTMSNPKWDRRGNTLTSCHSFNSIEYPYNNGCSGYARDKYTFIVFTAADASDPETLNNRKTTRQIFVYKPGNGLLMQSRFYNTSGGTYGAMEDSKLYRDLIQREISALEDVPNLWKTYPYLNGKEHCVSIGCGFGGYADWNYSDFDAKISIRADHENDYESLEVGTYGLCICCGEETEIGLYCDDCKENGNKCDDCESMVDELLTVYDSHGNERQVCQRCRDRYYSYCDSCDRYYPCDDITRTSNGADVCLRCLEEYYTQCGHCEEYFRNEDVYPAVNDTGCEISICEDCRDEHYTLCVHCGQYIHDDNVVEAYDTDGDSICICSNCCDAYYVECKDCGEFFDESIMNERLCPKCKAETKIKVEMEAAV